MVADENFYYFLLNNKDDNIFYFFISFIYLSISRKLDVWIVG